MAKRLEVIDIDEQSSASQITDWSKCVICQKQNEEKLECPANSKIRDSGAGYRSFVQNIQLFQEMNILPISLNLERLDQGDGIEETLMLKKASWHTSCRCKFNSTKLKRAEKRKSDSTSETPENRNTRSKTDTSSASLSCFFCDESFVNQDYREASTLELDSRVR